ncbi:MAG: type II secretion system F family protein [Phycisphaerae bacterium]|nr:type II secretion system F family protein [Phycisphaerae bacterium]
MIETLDILAEQALMAKPVWTWVVSGGLFAVVVLLVVSIFGQAGEVHLSPQREAAIATGHLDRKTLFENPIFRPLLWILLSISHHFNFQRGKEFLRKQLVAAGSPNYYTPEEYLAISLLTGLGIGAMFEICYFMAIGQFSVTIVILGMVIGISISLYSIVEKASKRLRDITRQLPYSLDLISLAMGAGATFTEAVKTIVRDGDDPLNIEFNAMLAEIDLGTTRRAALENMAERIPLTSVQGIVASVMQAEELGTPLSYVLHDQSTMLRMQRSVRAENKAASASVRILIPCLLLVIAVILTIFGPAIIRTVQGGLF